MRQAKWKIVRRPLHAVVWFAGLALMLTEAQGGVQEERRPAAMPELTVTGTRLRRDLPQDAFPLTVIDRDQLNVSGATFLGEYVQQLPFVTGSPLNSSTGARGQGGQLSRGINTVELRGLGPERTLVLVNGRRMLRGGNGASGVVDLNMIPMALVERIEILKAGASVQYGADAVAGVVNVITRKATEGLEFAARGGATSEWDGENWTASAVYGARGERGQFMIGFEYADQEAVGKGEREFSRVRRTFSGADNRITFDGSSAPPQGNFQTSLGRLTLIENEDGREPSDFRPYIGDNTNPNTDRFNFNPFEDLQQPSERVSIFSEWRYGFSQKLNVFSEILFHDRDSRTQLAPLPFFTTRETDVVVSADNVYNPFGERLTDVRRRLVEAGPRQFVQDNQAWRVAVGAHGLLAGWFWDVSMVRGRNVTDQSQMGDLLDSRLRDALGPSFVDVDGNAVCGTQSEPITRLCPSQPLWRRRQHHARDAGLRRRRSC
ncbi:MAG: TonB-dependent receptor plug domain-containing protein [Gammaproteobacteria bacterium]|nr:TonB-dependent receptor plug domain-containing protein [Gammaproteobacteria bacterium]